MPNLKSKKIVESLNLKVAKAKSIVFADYLGLKANALNELRRKVAAENAEVVVAKNSLVRTALEANGLKTEEVTKDLKESTAVVFSYGDPVSPVKALFEFAKSLELPKVKSAILESKYFSKAQVQELSTLPSKNELIARTLGGMKAPISGFVNVLGGVQKKFIYAVKAIADQKSN